MVEFLYLRLIGLCNIVDGFVMLSSPWRPRLALRSAKRLAKYRGSKRFRDSVPSVRGDG